MIIGTLGPEGTCSHQLAKQFPHTKLVFAMNVSDLFEIYDQKLLDQVLVPIENTLMGTNLETLDQLLKMNGFILEETIVPVDYCLSSFEEMERIEKLYVSSHVYRECRGFLEKHFVDLELILTVDSTWAKKKLLENPQKSAAIINKHLSKINQIPILYENVQKNDLNLTRYILVGREKAKPTDGDKTSMFIFLSENRCGVLAEILALFVHQKINLLRVESRLLFETQGELYFFIDFEGHEKDNNVQKALVELKKIAKYKIVGSYPFKHEQKRESQKNSRDFRQSFSLS